MSGIVCQEHECPEYGINEVIDAYIRHYCARFGKSPAMDRSKNEEKAHQLIKLLSENGLQLNEFFDAFFRSQHKFLKENGYTLTMAVSLFDIISSSHDSQMLGNNKFIAQLNEEQRGEVADYFMATSVGVIKK